MNPITAQLSANLILLIQFFAVFIGLMLTPNVGAHIFCENARTTSLQVLTWSFCWAVFIFLTFLC
jgi:hypothetical protein